MPTISGGGTFTGGVSIILPTATGRVPQPNVSVNAWDLDYAQPESNTSNLWDVTTAIYLQDISLQSAIGGTGGPRGLHLKDDGTKMYATANGVDAVFEWDLTRAYDVSSASYVQSFNTNSYETNNRSVTFKPDGSKMYTIGYQADDVTQYDLSDSWNVASASYVTEFSVKTEEANPDAVEFKTDGTKMFVTGSSGDDINEYDLSTAWDISTASFSQASSSMGGTETAPKGMAFKPDGTSVWVTGINSDSVDRYNFSSAWDVSTMSYGNEDIVIGFNPESIWFKSDGSAFYTIQNQWNAYQWLVGTKLFYVGNEESTPNSVWLKSDGTKMYIIGQNGDEINEYDLSVAWEVETASLSQTTSVQTWENTPTGFYFKSDGSTMWVVGSGGDDVNEFSLSTPWDTSTISFEQNFSVSGQDTVPEGIEFKTDGTKMYVSGSTNDNIYEYDLSTAWDISTATYSQSFSPNINPTDVRFKPDGTKMFVLNRSTNADAIYEYSLTTPWDISTASQTKVINVPDNTPTGMFFKSDGEAMWMVGSGNKNVVQYEFT